ncbi:MAG: amidohydrolase/deacetylase family metallohydrolase, partial [Bacteroidales bacterium]|nr:amidohydrolase/deacetylase family metallohydrolase [Bacteroidales bacterium]
MKLQKLLILFISLTISGLAIGQTYNIVIKGGHVIDPKNNINAVMDVAVKDGKIALLAKNIDAKEGRQVVDAKGMYVTPGLIDMHVHVYHGTVLDHQYCNGPNSVVPDGFTFRSGVTTVVDAGCAGWRSFPEFKRNIIDRSQTRVLALLNIVGDGMRGGPAEQNLKDMEPVRTGEYAKKYSEDIVGIKLAHYSGHEWEPTDKTVEAGRIADMPVMIDFGGAEPPLPIEELFMKHLRPGDIFTHCFAQLGSGREYVVDPVEGKVRPFVWDAIKRGIIFDVGYGGISFSYSQGIPAIKSGLYPHVISTDLHTGSMNAAMKDLVTTMSKFLAMGMDLQSVIKATTSEPARVIKREELG